MRLIDRIPPGAIERIRSLRLTQWRLLPGALSLIVLIIVACVSYCLLLPPRAFPTGELIELPADATVAEMGAILREQGAIRSPLAFKAYARLTGSDRELASGLFVFEKPLGLALLTHRLANSEHGIAPIRVTLTEGMTVSDMSEALAREIPGFDTERFLDLASTSEGFLFPDTYFFMPGATPEEAVSRARARFDERIGSIESELGVSGRPLRDIVVIASLLEREAKSSEDKRIVAGILWKRLDSGMLLQVDAVFGYIRGENGYVPTSNDLELDDPYNTYLYEGLPPGPISNPGLESLLAAAQPLQTEYLYYLTGRDGNMYYGQTFEEHKENRTSYLD